MTDDIDVSVVIGFKDWGLTRLRLAVSSIQESFGSLRGEVIVSDYGSIVWEETKSVMEGLGARYVYTQTDGTWSRSRALNAGFEVSRGKILISTDADMIFSPRAMEVIGSTLIHDQSLCILLQCRDLPEIWSDAEIAVSGPDWAAFEETARLRPRWGMGGMMAVPRETYMRIRGLDERMHTYGGEDIDFATRARRAGQRLVWLDHPGARMYHMWHPSTRKVLSVSAAADKAIAFNKEIVYNDSTFVRNTPHWIHRPSDAQPLVTVAISTYNRAAYLSQSINSVLAQTMQDFEIVVVDDGSTDNTQTVVESFRDSRIKYIYQENAGISAARNRAADASTGYYTVVLDDDDLMTPWRLEKHFEHLSIGSHGTFGSFVNFDDVSGEMKLYASKKLNAGTVFSSGGAPGHGTWMVETELLRRIRYDESLSSGVDNNMALRLVRSGVILQHTGEIMMLRRMHPGQITVSEEETQIRAAKQTRQMFSYMTTKWGGDKLNAERGPGDYVPIRFAKDLSPLLAYLPDHLVYRVLRFTGGIESPSVVAGPYPEVVNEYCDDGRILKSSGVINDAGLADIAAVAGAGAAYEVDVVLRSNMAGRSVVEEDPSAVLRRAVHRSLEVFAAPFLREGSIPSVVAAVCGYLNLEGIPNSVFEHRNFEYKSAKLGATFVGGIDLDVLMGIAARENLTILEALTDYEVEDLLGNEVHTAVVEVGGVK